MGELRRVGVTGPELHVVVPGPLDERTGGSIYDRRMVEGLRRRGWVVVVSSLAGQSSTGNGRRGDGLAEALQGIPDGTPVVIDGLAMSGEPDVVRGHAPRLTTLALIHQLLADEHGLQPSQRDRAVELERDALACTAGIIVTSPFTASRVQAMGLDPAVIQTVPPGTDPAPLARGPGPGAPPRLLCVASVTPGKGHDVLVRALARLADVPWHCICVGSLTRSPAYARLVQSQARDAGLDGRVFFAGECDETSVDTLYLTSSVFVLASYYEAFGMALTEAMARGLPVVSTTAGAIPDTVPSDAGILVPPGDDVALSGALRELLVDAPHEPYDALARRSRLGTAARRHAARLPGWDEAVDAFADAVSALSRSARPRRGCLDRLAM